MPMMRPGANTIFCAHIRHIAEGVQASTWCRREVGNVTSSEEPAYTIVGSEEEARAFVHAEAARRGFPEIHWQA